MATAAVDFPRLPAQSGSHRWLVEVTSTTLAWLERLPRDRNKPVAHCRMWEVGGRRPVEAIVAVGASARGNVGR